MRRGFDRTSSWWEQASAAWPCSGAAPQLAAELPHLPALVGSLAWLSWLFLHLVMLIGFRNRLSVLVNWAWNYLTWDRGPRLIFGPDPKGPGGS